MQAENFLELKTPKTTYDVMSTFPADFVVLSSIHTDLRGYMDMINFCTSDKQRKSLPPYSKIDKNSAEQIFS